MSVVTGVVAARGGLPVFLLLYGLLYASYGIEGPFLPALLAERGLGPEAIGLLFAAGTGVRLVSGPLAAAVADRSGNPRLVLAACMMAAAAATAGYVLAGGFTALLLVGVVVSLALAPVNPMADALAMAASLRPRAGFDYGLVRGAGSAAFVAAAALAGWLVAGLGNAAAVVAGVVLLAAAAAMVPLLPGSVPSKTEAAPRGSLAGARGLLRLPGFTRLLLLGGLVQGSHAVYGAFATLHWQQAGIAPGAIGLLWAVAVASEIVVFALTGPWLLRVLGPARLAALAAAAGVVRWAIMASTAALPVQFLLQPLHGLTFAALHLASLRLLAGMVPPQLSATAFSLQATLGAGLATALLTLLAGPLFAHAGALAFWAMAALCALAMPVALALQDEPRVEALPMPAMAPGMAE